MMNVKYLWLVALMAMGQAMQAQPVIQFEQRDHDFGTIKEVDGAASFDFVFYNRGKSPIIIKNVESSCGCTSPEWSKQPVVPGQKGYIRATFDPKDRPGHFDKTVTVYSNATTPVVELKIKGTVEPRTRTALDEYPYETDSGLRLTQDHLSLMNVRKGARKSAEFGVYNNSGKAVTVAFADMPSWAKVSIEPAKMEPKGKATIKVACDATMAGEFGLNDKSMSMTVNGKKYPLRVSMNVEEDFSGVDAASAPAVTAEKKYYNFGKTASGVKASYAYKITNTGKSVLRIHRVYANNNCVKVTSMAKEVQPGASTEIKAETVAGASAGKLAGVISVITNAPATPELSLRFYGEVE